MLLIWGGFESNPYYSVHQPIFCEKYEEATSMTTEVDYFSVLGPIYLRDKNNDDRDSPLSP